MIKTRMVEMQPPPNFHAAAPARSPRNGPSISFSFASLGLTWNNDPSAAVRAGDPLSPRGLTQLDAASPPVIQTNHCCDSSRGTKALIGQRNARSVDRMLPRCCGLHLFCLAFFHARA